MLKTCCCRGLKTRPPISPPIRQINCNLSKKHQYKNSGPCHSVMTQAAFVVILLFTLYKTNTNYVRANVLFKVEHQRAAHVKL